MTNGEFAFEAVHGDDVHVVSVHGELDLANADRLRDALVEIAGSTVVVDLSDLAFCDSSGLAAIVGARNRIMASGNTFELRGAVGVVRRTLELTGLGGLLVD
ncbi:MAG: STAS domain-containing protein [Acidimicrobiales bacterium]